jgi:hydrogenase maturation factor
MCLGSIARLAQTWEEERVPLGRLDDGKVVTLSFVPHARAGDHLLVELGIPVEILDADYAAEALAIREEAR